jgi:hypothetical protein
MDMKNVRKLPIRYSSKPTNCPEVTRIRTASIQTNNIE